MPNEAQKRDYDWTLQDVTLAEQHGISRERVRQLRRAAGAPKPYNFRRKRKAVLLVPKFSPCFSPESGDPCP
jgi:hypothetical protein